MKVGEKIQDFVYRLRQLPESQRKIILFSIVGVFGILFFIFGVALTNQGLKNIQQDINSIDIDKTLPNPKVSEPLEKEEQPNIGFPNIPPENTSETENSNLIQ